MKGQDTPSRFPQTADFAEDAFKGKTILLVDPDLSDLMELTATLEAWGLNVQMARSRLDALDRIESGTKIDCVLMQLHSQPIEGDQLIRRLHEQNQFENIPVVLYDSNAVDAGSPLPEPLPLRRLHELLKQSLRRPSK